MRKSKVRTALRQAGIALAEGDLAAAREAVLHATSQLDKASQHGVIHRNNASRHKSRLMRRLAALET